MGSSTGTDGRPRSDPAAAGDGAGAPVPWGGWSDMNVFDAIFTPRATRIYKKQSIPDELLTRIVRAGTFACSSGNTQPWELIAVTDGEVKQRLHQELAAAFAKVDANRSQTAKQLVDGAGRPITGHDAVANIVNVSVIIMVFWNPDRGIRFHGEYEENPDGTLREVNPHAGGRGASLFPACQNMILAAQALGLQSLFTTFFDLVEPQAKEILGVPPRMFLESAVFVGYGDEELKRARRRPLGEVLHLNHWDRRWAGSPTVTI